MLASWTRDGFGALLTAAVVVATVSTIGTAEAKSKSSHAASRAFASGHAYRYQHFGRYAHRISLRHWASVLQCVPFARENSGIELTGNAGNWWENAAGLYERGSRPEVGSILNFRAAGRMRMGHVAVVTNVVDSRHIEIDHANWSGPGVITRDIDVVDVSPNNDWTAVRVALGQSEDDFGSTYPTYGFIYDRPDTGTMVANTGVVPGAHSTPEQLALNDVPTAPEEVAEAADEAEPKSYTYGWHHRAGRYHTAAGRFRSHYHTAAGRGFTGHASTSRAFTGRASVYRVSSRAASPTPRHHRS